MMDKVLITGGLFGILMAVFGIVGLLGYFFSKAIYKQGFANNKTTNQRLKLFWLTLVIGFSGYFAYTAVYPTDDFYRAEFETITLRKLPNSAKILQKSATYPNFHGDYSSDATIELSPNDFQNLLKQMQHDKRFSQLPTQDNKESAIFQRDISDQADKFYAIRFLADGKTITIQVDVT